MKSIGYRLVATSLVLAALAPGAPVLAQEAGITAAVHNNVRITTAADPKLHRAVVREVLSMGNDVVTGNASMAQLLMLDKTSITVGANAQLRINRFVYDPSRNASSITAEVVKGAFRFLSGRSLHAHPGQTAVRTPAASIGIRGTMFSGAVGPQAIRIARGEPGIRHNFVADPKTATLIILRGPGRQAKGAMPGAIDVKVGDTVITLDHVGMAVFIPAAGQPPIGPFYISDKGTRTLRALLGPYPMPVQPTPWMVDPITNYDLLDPASRQGG